MREDVEEIFDQVNADLELDEDQQEFFNLVKARVLRKLEIFED